MIYTNWRGKQFIIDQKFVDELKEFVLEEGENPKELDWLTPEKVFDLLPDMERWERHFQLEEMWNQSPASARITTQLSLRQVYSVCLRLPSV